MVTAKKKEISIIERRLKSGSVFSAGSRPIPLKEPAHWVARIVNGQISDARLYEMQAEKGWVYLTIDDLAVKPEEIGFREMDGRIVRGTQGQEVVMKIARKDYEAIQALKDQTNRDNTFSPDANKAAIVSAAQRQPDGGRGAEFLHRAVQGLDITDSRERVSLED